MNSCEVHWGRHGCDGAASTECFRCGLPACKPCSIIIPYLYYGRKRIGIDCLDEMARHDELDYLVEMFAPCSGDTFNDGIEAAARKVEEIRKKLGIGVDARHFAEEIRKLARRK